MTLSKLAQQLDDARRDVATLTRLQDAQKRAEELTAVYNEAKAQVDHEAAKKAAAAHEALMDGITDVHIADLTPTTEGEAGLLRRRFQIAYTRPEFNSRMGCSAPKQRVVDGFAAVPAPVMLYLLEKRPEQIPATIMALAPNEPRLAFTRYAAARLRGHL